MKLEKGTRLLVHEEAVWVKKIVLLPTATYTLSQIKLNTGQWIYFNIKAGFVDVEGYPINVQILTKYGNYQTSDNVFCKKHQQHGVVESVDERGVFVLLESGNKRTYTNEGRASLEGKKVLKKLRVKI